MKLINADRITEALMGLADKEHGNQHYMNGIRTALELIGNEPEGVVRCWDCVYWEPTTFSSGNCGRAFEITAYKDDYCSYGERRTDEA